MNKFIQTKDLETAVLFLIFNRLDTTKQVFAAIRKAKPPRLYIAADGARADKESEDEKVKEVREYVMSHVDWDCEVKTLFRDKNLGCKYAVSGAIDWFFENEEMGIILEDDCLPSQSFFWFCEELLERYKDDMRVWHIGGNTFGYSKESNITYSWIRFAQVWGWATWQNRWIHYDKDLNNFNKDFKYEKHISTFLNINSIEAKELKKRFYSSASSALGTVDTWDYQWQSTVIKNHGLCIIPLKNLISNLGVGIYATHTINDKRTHLQKHEINFPIVHPSTFLINYDLEEYFKIMMNIKYSYSKYLIHLLKRICLSPLKTWSRLVKLKTLIL